MRIDSLLAVLIVGQCLTVAHAGDFGFSMAEIEARFAAARKITHVDLELVKDWKCFFGWQAAKTCNCKMKSDFPQLTG
jgi:hypothetical protein